MVKFEKDAEGKSWTVWDWSIRTKNDEIIGYIQYDKESEEFYYYQFQSTILITSNDLKEVMNKLEDLNNE